MFKYWFIMLFLPLASWGQKYDYHWIMGGRVGGSTDTSFGIISLDFNYDPPLLSKMQEVDDNPDYIMYHGYNAAPISDAEGRLQFYTGGTGVRNHKHNDITGSPLLTGPASDFGPQQITVVPDPGAEGRYIVVQDSSAWYWPTQNQGFVLAVKFYYSIIDMNVNDGEGEIVLKRQEFVPGDTTHSGRIAAVRHGNGRDWWVLKRDFMSNRIKRYLISPDKYEYVGEQEILPIEKSLTGQIIFSPKGDKYVIYGSDGNPPDHFMMFDFDRCSGMLSNPITKLYYPNYWRAVAFSPSGRFLYLTAIDTMYQYDMEAPDLFDSETIVGIHQQVPGTFGSTRPFQSVMGPDGRIYWSTSGGTKYMNVIDYPDEKGLACGMRWRQYMGAFMGSTTPNYPNYRLGPLDGSPCDTLGLDNVPLAEFRVRSDSTLTVRFIDRSAYEPEQWWWTFGDGGTSTAIHPTHTYASSGSYEVCLTVSNANGADTYCRTITLGTVATEDIRHQAQVAVFPNPARDYLNVNIAGFHPIGARLELWDVQGRRAHHTPLESGLQSVALPSLPPGLYVWRILLGGEPLATGKLVVK
jgi:hypothetical protein